MKETIQGKMLELQCSILEYDYYVHIYQQALIDQSMTMDKVFDKIYNQNQIVNLCNQFWMLLPDSAAIRKGPFFEICDIAELCFED